MLDKLFAVKKEIVQSTKVLKLNFEPDKNHVKEYETLLNSLYGLKYTSEKEVPTFTFGILSSSDKTEFYVVVPEQMESVFKRKYAVVDPYIEFIDITDPLIDFAQTKVKDDLYHIEGYEMKLLENEADKKLKTSNADKLFMSNLIHSMNNIGTSDKSILEISIKPNGATFQNLETDSKLIKGLTFGTDLLMRGTEMLLDATITNGEFAKIRQSNKDKQEKAEKSNKFDIKDKEMLAYNFAPRFSISIKIASKSPNYVNMMDNIKSMAATFADLSESNSLIPIKIKYDDIIKRHIKGDTILSTPEICQFLHLPDSDVSSENIITSNCRKVYDRDVPSEGVVFGTSNNKPVAFPALKLPLSIEAYTKIYSKIQKLVDNLVKPRLILGQQGTGKSEWLINYIIALAELGISIIVVDPKNDTQQRLIESLPDRHINRLDYINLGDTQYPPAFNIFKRRNRNDPTENSLIVTSFISLMKKEFNKNWGFKIQRTLQMTAEAILLDDISTMNEFEMMLTERSYREYMIMKMEALIQDEETKGTSHIKKLLKYWKEFNSQEDKYIVKDIEPVMNQIGVFLSNRIVKSIVSQKESYDFRKAADSGRIVIINLPEGTLRDNTRLLASMINKSIWLDIQSRADIDISERYPVAWIIDEAHGIVDDEFINVLTKARGYRLGLTLVTQGLSNFKFMGMDDIKETVLTNCKNKIAFRLGRQDASEFKEEFEPLTYSDLANCPDYHFYSKIILENGTISDPFFCDAPPCAKKLRNYDEFVKKHRSGKFTVDQIEDELDERLESVGVLKALITV